MRDDWTETADGVWRSRVSPSLLCLRVVRAKNANGEDLYWPQVNGRQVRRGYDDLATAKAVAEEAARRLLREALRELEEIR